jgi:competence protein ComEC
MAIEHTIFRSWFVLTPLLQFRLRMQWLRSARYKQTTLVFLACLAFLVGVGVARKGVVIDASWWWLCLIGVLWVRKKKNIATALLVIAFGFSFGWWRGEAYMAHLAEFDQHYYKQVTLVGRASDDATYDSKKQLTFDTYNVYIPATGQTLTGKVGVSGYGVPAVFAGDSFTVSGKLYPSRGSYQAKISFANIHITGHHSSIVQDLRRKFAAGMESALPEPLASFGMGLLIGQKANLPDTIYDELLMVGLVHIIAVSGYNLTIILRATNGMLSKHSKRLSLLLALSLIAVFLLFAGGSASIVRAAIVSSLSIAALFYGRRVKPLVLIMFAAAITAWAKPYYVWSDVSWYLSFLAFFGVMIVAPLVQSRLPRRVAGSLVAAIAIESLCAELMTLPYVLHIFGQMSFIGLVANVLVVALVPLAMLLCLWAGLAGMLVPGIAGWIAFPAKLLLTYMLDIANLLSHIPHVFVEGIGLSLVSLLLLYGIIAVMVVALARNVRQKQIQKLPEPIIDSQ